MPFSVMKPATISAGVTSKAGLSALEPAGAILTPPISVTSFSARC